MIYPSSNAKRVQIGRYYEPRPMAYSGTYIVARRIERPKPMALTVTRRMHFMRGVRVAVADWRATRLRKRASELPGESGSLAWLLVALAVLCIVLAWHMVAR